MEPSSSEMGLACWNRSPRMLDFPFKCSCLQRQWQFRESPVIPLGRKHKTSVLLSRVRGNLSSSSLWGCSLLPMAKNQHVNGPVKSFGYAFTELYSLDLLLKPVGKSFEKYGCQSQGAFLQALWKVTLDGNFRERLTFCWEFPLRKTFIWPWHVICP